MNSLGRRVVIASIGGAFLVLACYALVGYQLEQWTRATDRVMLNYERALHDGRLRVALTRAAGEAASYVLSRDPDYRAEAEEALRHAQQALDALQRILETTPSHDEIDLHRLYVQRQTELLQSMRARVEQVLDTLPTTTDDAGLRRLVRIVYADEAQTDALWTEMAAHHQADLRQGEQSLRIRSRISRSIAIGATATVLLAIAVLVHYVRRHVVAPLAALARLTEAFGAGDLKLRSPVTDGNEIGQLQLSFNHAAEQIARQRGALTRAVESLKTSRDAAMAASQAKSTFLANVSHEIRTPLHSVIVSLDLLHDTTADLAERRLADVARSSARGLLGMLNDLLDVSRIEAGKLSLQLANFDLREQVAHVVELHGKSAAVKGLALSLRVDDAVPARVRGDPQRVGQVLGNLLSNAIKFTEQGTIEIAVTLEEAPPDAAQAEGTAAQWLRLRVSDPGVGIPAEAAQLIFEPFFQTTGTAGARADGLGLGLGIARELARTMGGQLGFESEVGKGSSFWFIVPLRPDADCAVAAPAPPAATLMLPGKSVLLVEDHAASREVMTRMLRRRGLEVTTAENGRVAVELASRTTFDLILMDCRMPDMDGFEATRRVRALGDERARVPIVGLTAFGLVERQGYLDAGFDDLVVKPYTLDEIERALRRWLVDAPRAARNTDTAAPAAPTSPSA